jgi:multidrug efflux system membrane fusion protein
VVIQQVEPIYVGFSVPEARLPAVVELLRKGRPEVSATPSGAAGGAPDKGILTFIDNGVDPKTGTIRLKATFENRSRRLWPGQFVNVALSLGIVENGLVVPAAAVQTGQAGQYVYVVNPDKTATVRPVRVGLNRGQDAEVAAGLEAGETVVVDGQLLLSPGTIVEARQEGTAGGGSAPVQAAGAPTAKGDTGP